MRRTTRSRAQLRRAIFLEGEAAVIGGDTDAHQHCTAARSTMACARRQTFSTVKP
jgi:hypothetical protein